MKISTLTTSRFTRTCLAFSLGLGTMASAPIAFAAPEAVTAQSRSDSQYQQDRADILAMAGDYKVKFDMQESTRWMADYEPLDPKISGGYKSVRVIEDSGNKIILQHLLVVDMGEGSHIVKHWRQDWEYEPAQLLAYKGEGVWKLEDIASDKRKGAWSQTVYQVDDSPRYAGIGQWEEKDGVRQWQSDETWRPLARRDTVRHPIYDRYHSVNRHANTPDGWIHFQDNIKMKQGENGALKPVVSEYVLNTYYKFNDYDVAAADDYWAKTKDYWASVRQGWDDLLAKNGEINVTEEAATGTVISAELLEMGTQIAKGELSSDAAIARADQLISGKDTRLAAAKQSGE